MQQIIGIEEHDQMTCLVDGLRKLATRNSRLRTPGIIPSQTIAQISIAQYNITAS